MASAVPLLSPGAPLPRSLTDDELAPIVARPRMLSRFSSASIGPERGFSAAMSPPNKALFVAGGIPASACGRALDSDADDRVAKDLAAGDDGQDPTQAQSVAFAVGPSERLIGEEDVEVAAVPSFSVNLLIAAFSVFQGATDGLSLGSLVFPHDEAHPNSEYMSLGMSIGLLSAFVCNLASVFTSQFPHAVGGVVMPVIPLMAAFFNRLGAENCPTVMVAMPLMTCICGLLTYLMGRVGVQDIVKACPFVVFGGFIAGTGAQLLEFALNMMYPTFTTITSFGPGGIGAFLERDFWMFCGPGIVLALVVFAVPRLNPSGQHTFLLPAGVIILAIAFYVVLYTAGVSVEEARRHGWLFEVRVPESPDFYKVWTQQNFSDVRWDLICSTDFVVTTLQVFLIGFLTTTKNIYGTSEFTHWSVDIDQEIRAAGIQGALCGLVGGMPGNNVMSFAITAHQLGVRTRLFSALLASLSLCFFLFGDYAIAYMPKMAPAAMLFWLGLILVVSWIWDLVGSMSGVEHGIVILMIVVDLFADVGTMLLLGIFLTLILGVKRMMGMRFIASEYTLFEVRSDVLRTGDQANILADHAKEVLVLRLARGYFSFANASSVVDLVHEAVARAERGEGAVLRVLALDVQDVLGVDTTALNALAELQASATRGEFLLVVAGCQPSVEAAVRAFGIPLDASGGDYDSLMELAATLGERARAPSRAGADACGGYRLVLVKSLDAPWRFASATVVALEFSERLLLSTYLPPSAEPTFPAQRRTALGQAVRNPSLLEVSAALSASGHVDPGGPALPLLVDIHCWLSGYMVTYEPSLLPALAGACDVLTFAEGDVIHPRAAGAASKMPVYASGPGPHVPPLLWLLGGEVEHTWAGQDHEFSHFRGIELSYGLRAHQRLEKAELPFDNVHYCVGPFQTDLGFRASMMHPARLVATQRSRCVLVERSRFAVLARSHPDAADALQTYIARKRFVLTSLAKADGPRLFL